MHSHVQRTSNSAPIFHTNVWMGSITKWFVRDVARRPPYLLHLYGLYNPSHPQKVWRQCLLQWFQPWPYLLFAIQSRIRDTWMTLFVSEIWKRITILEDTYCGTTISTTEFVFTASLLQWAPGRMLDKVSIRPYIEISVCLSCETNSQQCVIWLYVHKWFLLPIIFIYINFY